MVPDSLNESLRGALAGLRRHAGVMLTALAAGSFSLLLLAWLLMDQGERSIAGDRPSLLELLDQVSGERGRQLEDKPVVTPPMAPRSRSWSSPLARQCSGIDAALLSRLESLQKRSGSWRAYVAIDPTNFGKRHQTDAFGRPLDASPRVVVLHETVYSLSSAVNTFMTPHPRDEDQVSYHTLVGLDGSIVDVVDPLKRAYGAGYSAFLGEWAVTNSEFDGSVNNFALHLSLETPDDGQGRTGNHSGYTAAQYDALALVLDGWLERFEIDPAAITTHRHVDLGGARADPRSFSWSDLQQRLAALGTMCHS